MTTESQRNGVREWLPKAPFDDPRLAKQPNFSYEEWFAEGRALPGSVEALIELLEAEDLKKPSGDGMRVAYALGWIGDRRQRVIDALVRALGSADAALRIEAAAALGRVGNAGAVPILETLLADKREDINVRANSCISIGRLGAPSSVGLLRSTTTDGNPFLAASAAEALRLHEATKAPVKP